MRADDRLFYFPETPTEVGTVPAFYDSVPSYFAADAIAAGGRDVTDQPGASAAYERQLRYADECAS